MAALVEYIAFFIRLMNIPLAACGQLLRMMDFGRNVLML